MQAFSVAKLVWVMDERRVRELKREIRQLVTTAAAMNTGANGGDAASDRLKVLETELHGIRNRDAKPLEPASQTPLNQEDFERMMGA